MVILNLLEGCYNTILTQSHIFGIRTLLILRLLFFNYCSWSFLDFDNVRVTIVSEDTISILSGAILLKLLKINFWVPWKLKVSRPVLDVNYIVSCRYIPQILLCILISSCKAFDVLLWNLSRASRSRSRFSATLLLACRLLFLLINFDLYNPWRLVEWFLLLLVSQCTTRPLCSMHLLLNPHMQLIDLLFMTTLSHYSSNRFRFTTPFCLSTSLFLFI